MRFVAFAAAVLLTGCGSPVLPPLELSAQVAGATRVPTTALLVTDSVRYGFAPTRARYIPFKRGAYAQTSTHLYLLDYDATSTGFTVVRTIPLSSVRVVSVASRGAFNHLKQLQIEVAEGSVAVNFSNYADAEAGDAARTQVATKALESAGIRVVAAESWFLPSELRDYAAPVPAVK